MRSTSDARKARSRIPRPSSSTGWSHGCRHSGILTGQCGDPAVQQLTSVRQQASDGAVEDKADIRRNTSRRPVTDHRAPANDLEPGNLEGIVADQLNCRSHDRAAPRLWMQAKANFGEPVSFQVKVDAATEATLGTSLSLDGPAESFTAGPAGGGQCKKLLGVSELVAILRRRDTRPADHLGIAALLHHPRKVAPTSRPECDTGLRVNQNRHAVGERPGRGQRGWARIGHELHPT